MKTLKDSKPILFEVVASMNMLALESKMGPFWAAVASYRSSELLCHFHEVTRTIAGTYHVHVPLVKPAFDQGIAMGTFLLHTLNDVGSGLSPFQIFTSENRNAARIRLNNQVYDTIQAGNGVASLNAIKMVVSNLELSVPTSSESFCHQVEAYWVVMQAVMPNSKATRHFYSTIMLNLGAIVSGILEMYQAHDQPLMYLIAVMWW